MQNKLKFKGACITGVVGVACNRHMVFHSLVNLQKGERWVFKKKKMVDHYLTYNIDTLMQTLLWPSLWSDIWNQIVWRYPESTQHTTSIVSFTRKSRSAGHLPSRISHPTSKTCASWSRRSILTVTRRTASINFRWTTPKVPVVLMEKGSRCHGRNLNKREEVLDKWTMDTDTTPWMIIISTGIGHWSPKWVSILRSVDPQKIISCYRESLAHETSRLFPVSEHLEWEKIGRGMGETVDWALFEGWQMGKRLSISPWKMYVL